METLKAALEKVCHDVDLVNVLRSQPCEHVAQPWEDTPEAKMEDQDAREEAIASSNRCLKSNKTKLLQIESWLGSTYGDAMNLSDVKRKLHGLSLHETRDLALLFILEMRKIREVFRQELKEDIPALQKENERLRARVDELENLHGDIPPDKSQRFGLSIPQERAFHSYESINTALDILIRQSRQEMNLWR